MTLIPYQCPVRAGFVYGAAIGMNEKAKNEIDKACWTGDRCPDLGVNRIMISKFKPYPKYKDSGIKWIGEISEGL